MADLNVIHKAEVRFKINSLSKENLNGDDFVAWTKTHILEAIDYHTENLIEPHRMVQIPELELELDIDGQDEFFKNDETLRDFVWDQVYSTLKKAVVEFASSGTSLTKFRSNMLMTYLQTGQLSANYASDEWETLISSFFQELRESRKDYKELLKIVQNKHVFSRFYSLKKGSVVYQLFEIATGHKGASEIVKMLPDFLADNQNYFIKTNQLEVFYRAFNILSTGKSTLRTILQKLLKIFLIPDKLATKELNISGVKIIELQEALGTSILAEDSHMTDKTADKAYENISDTLPEGTYVGQAGLVLLAPFLKMFFKNLGYIGKKGQLLSRNRIPILLHYLATGEREASEWKLSLPKLLTGMDLGEHCATKINPTKKVDEHIAELLKSVIGHWEALKNTSPDGLRTTFLLRDGSLRLKNGFYYLYIEEETVDILLNYVSWNYSTIRLNWMKQIVFVEWNKN